MHLNMGRLTIRYILLPLKELKEIPDLCLINTGIKEVGPASGTYVGCPELPDGSKCIDKQSLV